MNALYVYLSIFKSKHGLALYYFKIKEPAFRQLLLAFLNINLSFDKQLRAVGLMMCVRRKNRRIGCPPDSVNLAMSKIRKIYRNKAIRRRESNVMR